MMGGGRGAIEYFSFPSAESGVRGGVGQQRCMIDDYG